jgi:hypothetical protein
MPLQKALTEAYAEIEKLKMEKCNCLYTITHLQGIIIKAGITLPEFWIPEPSDDHFLPSVAIPLFDTEQDHIGLPSSYR